MFFTSKRPLILITITTAIIFLATLAHAQPIISGKVVGISDGETVNVLQDRTQYKFRLYGIDCPESHQDFGAKAKQFVSDLIFKKDVKVIQKDIDRYGRVVGIVYLGAICVNEELIKAVFAWVYTRNAKTPSAGTG